jgi:hypothetical protein
MKKPLYYRQLNHIEVIVHHVGERENYAVKFRKRSRIGRMTSLFEPYDMALIAFLASDVSHLFTDTSLAELKPSNSTENQAILGVPKRKELS